MAGEGGSKGGGGKAWEDSRSIARYYVVLLYCVVIHRFSCFPVLRCFVVYLVFLCCALFRSRVMRIVLCLFCAMLD